jgi:hypothetical protein
MNLGRLSSFDYIDWVLKSGPYKNPKVYRPTPMQLINTNNGETLQAKNGYPGVLPADAEILSKRVDTPLCVSSIQNDLLNLTRFTHILNELYHQTVAQDLKNKVESQQAQVRTIFNEVIDDMKKNGSKYLQISNQYHQKYKDLETQWIAHKAKFKDHWGITKWWYREDNKRSTIQKNFDILQAKLQKDLKQYFFNHQILKRLDKMKEFNQKATPEEKEKFISLLQCEWETL